MEYRRAIVVAQSVLEFDPRSASSLGALADASLGLAQVLPPQNGEGLELANRAFEVSGQLVRMLPSSDYAAIRLPRAAAVLATIHQAIAQDAAQSASVRQEHATQAGEFLSTAIEAWSKLRPTALWLALPGERETLLAHSQ